MKSYLKQHPKLACFLSVVPIAFYAFILHGFKIDDRTHLPAVLQNDICVSLITVAIPVALALTTVILANALFASLFKLSMKDNDEASRYAKAYGWLYALCFIVPFTYGSFFGFAMSGCGPGSTSQHLLWYVQGYLLGGTVFGFEGLAAAFILSLIGETMRSIFSFRFSANVQP